MNQAQKDFADGILAYIHPITSKGRSNRSPEFYRGWTWAWGDHDRRHGETNIFPGDPDYNDGYTNKLTDLHPHEHSTPEGDYRLGSLTSGVA